MTKRVKRKEAAAKRQLVDKNEAERKLRAERRRFQKAVKTQRANDAVTEAARAFNGLDQKKRVGSMGEYARSGQMQATPLTASARSPGLPQDRAVDAPPSVDPVRGMDDQDSAEAKRLRFLSRSIP